MGSPRADVRVWPGRWPAVPVSAVSSIDHRGRGQRTAKERLVSFPRGRTRTATGGAAGGGGGGAGRMMGGGMFGRGGPDFIPVPPERRGQTIRRILWFFRPYRPQIAVVLVAILATSFIGLVNPILLKLLIDIAIPQRDWGLLNLFVGLMIALPILNGLIGVGQTYLNNVIGQNVIQDL